MLERGSSLELGSPSKTPQYHQKTGRPIRRGAGKVKPAAGYVDSRVLEEGDDEPIPSPSEDEDGHIIRPSRKRKRARTPSPSPPPLDNVIRQDEPDDHTDDEDSFLHHKKSHTSPVMLQFNVPLGFHGPLTVKLDPSLLVPGGEESAPRDLQPHGNSDASIPAIAETQSQRNGDPSKPGFTDLPPELRNKVYRHLFVHDFTVSFPPKYDHVPFGKRSLCWSAQFLATCKLVHSEGCSVLYGENTFLFDRNKRTRGVFWESVHEEIGFTDVRRFLRVIGPENLAYLRDVWIWLDDAAPSSTPYLDHEERRYINDNHLIDCLRILRSAKLRKVSLTFGGRRVLYRSDTRIISYLEQIKADEVVQKGPGHWYPQKINMVVFQDLQAAMTRKKKLYATK